MAGDEFTETNTVVFDDDFIYRADTQLTDRFDFLRQARHCQTRGMGLNYMTHQEIRGLVRVQAGP
jgi:hypothetical protein